MFAFFYLFLKIFDDCIILFEIFEKISEKNKKKF